MTSYMVIVEAQHGSADPERHIMRAGDEICLQTEDALVSFRVTGIIRETEPAQVVFADAGGWISGPSL